MPNPGLEPKKVAPPPCSKSSNKKCNMAMGQKLVPLVNPKIAGKWMFIPLKMVSIGTDPYPYVAWSPIPY